MIDSIKVTPKFKTKEIVESTLSKTWFEAQDSFMDIGIQLHKYMQDYISRHHKREGGTGNLAISINFDKEAGAGTGKIFWGIGDIDILNSRANYWYVVNYGKTDGGKPFIPGGGEFRPVIFNGNIPADSGLRGQGTQKATMIGKGDNVSPIRPMNYIQASLLKLDRDLANLLAKLKG